MKRQRRPVRLIVREGNVYVDKTVIIVCGGAKKTERLKEIVHGTYVCVADLTEESIEDGVIPPYHTKVYIEPADFSRRYLKRIS